MTEHHVPWDRVTLERLLVAAVLWVVGITTSTLYITAKLASYQKVVITNQEMILRTLMVQDAAQIERDLNKFKRLDALDERLKAVEKLAEFNRDKMIVLDDAKKGEYHKVTPNAKP